MSMETTSTQSYSPESSPTTLKQGNSKRARFSANEDNELREIVQKVGHKNWALVAEMMPGRNARQCKERWENYLSPNVSYGPWSNEEDELLKKLHTEYGPKWVQISRYFSNRTDTAIKNRWLLLERRNKGTTKRSRICAQKPAPTNEILDVSVFNIESDLGIFMDQLEGLDALSFEL